MADMEVADRLHADDFQLINPAGATVSKRQYLDGIASGEINYLVFEPDSDIDVRWYGATAAIRYRSNLKIILGGQAAGEDSGPNSYWHTDLYEFHDGRWQVIWSQATLIA